MNIHTNTHLLHTHTGLFPRQRCLSDFCLSVHTNWTNTHTHKHTPAGLLPGEGSLPARVSSTFVQVQGEPRPGLLVQLDLALLDRQIDRMRDRLIDR